MNGANGSGAITPSSMCFALRQNGSFSSLNSRSIIAALATQVDVGDVRLGLEHRTHERGEVWVELEDLLELVKDDAAAPVAFRRQLRGELEELLQRRVDVVLRVAGPEAEAERAVHRVDGHHRDDPQAAEDLLARSRARRSGVAMSS